VNMETRIVSKKPLWPSNTDGGRYHIEGRAAGTGVFPYYYIGRETICDIKTPSIELNNHILVISKLLVIVFKQLRSV